MVVSVVGRLESRTTAVSAHQVRDKIRFDVLHLSITNSKCKDNPSIPTTTISARNLEQQCFLLSRFFFSIPSDMSGVIYPQPPPMASIEETTAALESVPLFMKSLPEDAMDDPTLSALQSLIFDGTPDGAQTISQPHSLI